MLLLKLAGSPVKEL